MPETKADTTWYSMGVCRDEVEAFPVVKETDRMLIGLGSRTQKRSRYRCWYRTEREAIEARRENLTRRFEGAKADLEKFEARHPKPQEAR